MIGESNSEIFDGLLEGVQIIDRDFRYRYLNEAAARQGRRPASELVGLRMSEAYPGIERTHLYSVLDACLASTVPADLTNDFEYPDGSRGVFALRIRPIPDGLVIFSLDVTERQRLEESLAEQSALRERLSRVFESVPGVVYSFLLRADGTTAIPFASAAAEDVLGLCPGEVRGDAGPFIANVHPEDVDRVRAEAERCARELEPWCQVFRYHHPEHGQRLIEGTSMPVRQADGSVLFHGFLSDVTERVRAEDARRDAELRASLVFRRAPVAIAVVRQSDALVADANAAFARLVESRAVELRGRPAAEVLRFEPKPTATLRSVQLLVGAQQTRDVMVDTDELDYGGESYSVFFIEDVTERRRAEAALVEREAHAKAIIEATIDGFWLVDREARILEVNPSYVASSGYRRDELMGMRVNELEVLESPDETLAHIALIQTQGPEVFETVHRRKDGSLWDVEISATWFPELGGGRMFVFIRDLRHRKRSELLLRTRLELSELARSGSLEQVIERGLRAAEHLTGSAAAHFVFVREGRVVAPTPGAAPVTDLERELWDDCLRELAPAFDNTESRGPRTLVTHFERDAEPASLLGVSGKSEDYGAEDAGLLRSLLALLMDAVDRVRAEQARDASEERFRALVENLDAVVFSLDPAGTVSFVSRAVAALGHAPGDLLGRSLVELIAPQDVHAVTEAVTQAFSGSPQLLEARVASADGTLRQARLALGPLQVGARRVGVSGVLMDVTELRETEEQLRQAQKLEAVGQLAGGIAHDFNNILSVISSYSEFALESVHESDPLHADLQEIRAAAGRASSLTRQLLAFSRRQVLKPIVISLNTVVSGMHGLLRRLLGEDVELEVALDSALGNTRMDPGQLEQVVMNLAVNARDAMPAGGRLVLQSRNVDLDEYTAPELGLEPGRHVELAVSDSGSGIAPEVRSRIFEPFFTTKEVGRGTGLGLATVFGIVKQSGGSIAVDSEVGQGTTFRVILPRVEDVTEAPPALDHAGVERGKGELILVVEDEDAVRSLVRRILTAAGYRVLAAANGGEALLLCEKSTIAPKLLLTDVIMPQMSGRELAARLRQVVPALRVLYMSGYADSMVRGNVLETDADLLQKPFAASELTRKVRDALDIEL
ncbi:MAG: PAS domain S-box protein [Polyangiaceae bacterium]